MSLSADRHLDAIRTEGGRFWDTIDAASDLEARVPACPDWTVGDLAQHVAGVHIFWTKIVEPDAGTDDLPGRDALRRMVHVLGSADPQRFVWTWSAQQDVAFVIRHQVQETAVHRWDTQTATGIDVEPIAADLAADAIDEFLTLARPAVTEDSPPLPGSVHLHCTDVDGEWFVHPDGRVEPIHAKGDVALRGAASDLLLALYNRVPLDDLDVIGDRGVAEMFLDVHFG